MLSLRTSSGKFFRKCRIDLTIPFYFAMMAFCFPVALKYGERLLDSFDSTNFTSLLASLMASLLKCSLSDPSGSGSNSSRDCFLGFKYFSNAMCSSQLREMIVGKFSRLPDQPRKFSSSNDLPCTVISKEIWKETQQKCCTMQLCVTRSCW